MSDRKGITCFICSDPRFDFSTGIDYNPSDVFVPVPGVFLGSAKALRARTVQIQNFSERMAVFMPHHPCAAVPNANTAEGLGISYAEYLQHSGMRAVSLFLHPSSVTLHDPICDTRDSVVGRIFAQTGEAQRHQYGKIDGVKVNEIAIAPCFDISDLKRGTLYISSCFFGMRGLNAIKKVLGGFFPPRNYDRRVNPIERDLLELAFDSV